MSLEEGELESQLDDGVSVYFGSTAHVVSEAVEVDAAGTIQLFLGKWDWKKPKTV